MSLALHLAAADLRRLWPGFAALVGLHVLRVVAVEVPVIPPADHSSPAAALLAGADPLTLLIEIAATLLAVSIVVHRDPLIGRRAFWLTRPIPPWTLLAAKALTLSPLVIVPLVLNAGRLIAYGADAQALLASSLQLALSRAAWIGMAWLVAAVTSSTMAFLLAGIVIWVSFVVYGVLAYNFVQNFSDGLGPLRVAVPVVPTALGNWVTLSAATLASAGVLAWCYQTRRRGLAIALIGLTLIGLMTAGPLMPVLLHAGEPEEPAWAAALQVQLAEHRVTAESVATNARPRRVTYLAGLLDIAGLPDDYSATVIPRTSRVSANGAAVDGRGQPKTYELAQKRLDLVLTQAGFQGTQRAAPTYPPGLGQTYLQVNYAERLSPFLNRVVRIDADLEIQLAWHRLFAVLPLRAGAAVRHRRAFFEITHVSREGHQVVARVRHAEFPTFGGTASPEIQLAIYQPIDRMWTSIAQARSVGDTFSGFGFYLALPLSPYSSPWAGAWQSIHEVRSSEPVNGDFAAWQRSLQLLLVESTYEGRITRRWSDDRVYVAGEAVR